MNLCVGMILKWVVQVPGAGCSFCEISILVDTPAVFPGRQTSKVGFNPRKLHTDLSKPYHPKDVWTFELRHCSRDQEVYQACPKVKVTNEKKCSLVTFEY